MSSPPTDRSSFTWCEDCTATTPQHRFGAPRRYCDECRDRRLRERRAHRDPELHRKYNRESARRRRAAGRLT